jgi:hypothetical protein
VEGEVTGFEELLLRLDLVLGLGLGLMLWLGKCAIFIVFTIFALAIQLFEVMSWL